MHSTARKSALARRCNFAMEVYEATPIEGDTLDIKPAEPLFLADIARATGD